MTIHSNTNETWKDTKKDKVSESNKNGSMLDENLYFLRKICWEGETKIKFGFIKRVGKGRIKTVKGVECLRQDS